MKKTQAFTIVELVVVIVVIGILASITVVGYRFVVRDAKNAAIETTASSYIDALKVYYAKHGKYPLEGDMEAASVSSPMICLGDVGSYKNPENGCWWQNDTTKLGGTLSNKFDSEIRKIIDKQPRFKAECLTGWGGCRRGIVFVYSAGDHGMGGGYAVDGRARTFLAYYLHGKTNCNASGSGLAKISDDHPFEPSLGGMTTTELPDQHYTEQRSDGTLCMYVLP